MLKKQVSPKIVAIVFAVIVICFAVAVYVSAWTEPTAVPPGTNVSIPLNVSNTGQTKTGALRIGGLTVDNDTYLATVAGNVGIGTAAPSNKLHITKSSASGSGVAALLRTDNYIPNGAAGDGQSIEFFNSWASSVNARAGIEMRYISDFDHTSLVFRTRNGASYNNSMILDNNGNLELLGEVKSETLFSYSRNINANQYFAISFPVGAMGTCTIAAPTNSVNSVDLFIFSVGTTNAAVREVSDNDGTFSVLNRPLGTNRVSARNTTFCAGSDCSYNISCVGYNLYPATVASEPQ